MGCHSQAGLGGPQAGRPGEQGRQSEGAGMMQMSDRPQGRERERERERERSCFTLLLPSGPTSGCNVTISTCMGQNIVDIKQEFEAE